MTANAGYKAYATGDVLTAAQVQFNLQNQTVMYFASSSARTTALTGVTVEGMVSYIPGNGLEYYNGSTWTAVSTTGSVINILLNSNFAINQRAYVSAANLASGSYGFDRWKSNYTNTTLTFTASTQGQSVTINASGGLQQIIEQGLVPAGTYTLSWTGTATGRVYNSGGSAPSYAASPVTFTADGAANVVVEFTAVSTTKTLSKVQFNSGTNTTWSLATPTLQTELAACQRYYWQSEASSQYFWSGNTTNGSSYNQYCKLPTTMRVAPTITLTSYDNNSFPTTAGSAIRINTNSFLEQRTANATASGAYFGSSVIATSEL